MVIVYSLTYVISAMMGATVLSTQRATGLSTRGAVGMAALFVQPVIVVTLPLVLATLMRSTVTYDGQTRWLTVVVFVPLLSTSALFVFVTAAETVLFVCLFLLSKTVMHVMLAGEQIRNPDDFYTGISAGFGVQAICSFIVFALHVYAFVLCDVSVDTVVLSTLSGALPVDKEDDTHERAPGGAADSTAASASASASASAAAVDKRD